MSDAKDEGFKAHVGKAREIVDLNTAAGPCDDDDDTAVVTTGGLITDIAVALHEANVEREALLRCEAALRKVLSILSEEAPNIDFVGARAALTLLDEARAALGDST